MPARRQPPAMTLPRPITTDADRQDAADEAALGAPGALAPGQDALAWEAALWATRRSSGQPLSAEQAAALAAWLAADPAHAQALAALEHSHSRLRAMPQALQHALRAGLEREKEQLQAATEPSVQPAEPYTTAARPHPAAAQRPRASRWSASPWLPNLGMAAAVLALVGGGWLGWSYWRSQPLFSEHYATQRGQPLQVRLPDGSQMLLDAVSQAQVQLFRGRREVNLVEGQALFHAKPDAQRPFEVLAGHTKVTVLGTKFSVRHTRAGLDAGQTVVEVESGRVRVAQVGDDGNAGQTLAGAAAVDLVAGQRVTAQAEGSLEAPQALPVGNVAAWRKGRVNFQDAPLAQALAEFERYGDTGLVVRDPAVAAMRVGGSFDLREASSFAQALPLLLPVRLKTAGGVTEIVKAR